MTKVKSETYKGFKIEFSKSRKGFNMYNVNITKYKNKGFREEEYIFERLPTYTSKKSEALVMAKNFIDKNEQKLVFRSNGLSKANYLPSINDKKEDWKSVMRELKADRDKMSRSDLQGVVMAESLKLMKIFNIPKNKREEVENIFLLYIDDEMDINGAKRYFLEMT